MNAMRCVLLAAIAVFAIPTVSHADPFELTLETMMEAQAHNSLYIGHIFGPDDSVVLRFTSNLDPVARSFSFSLIPGQSYLGQPISLSTLGTYNSALDLYNWTIGGQLGSQGWSGVGSALWVGDPTGTVNTQVTLGGNLYQVMGTLQFTPGPAGAGTSTGMYTFTGPPGGPGGSGPFGPYPGTDAFRLGQWVHTVQVPPNPVVPNGQVVVSSGRNPFPGGGPGDFEVRITPVPEPSTLLLLGTGLAGVTASVRRRRKSKDT